MSEELEYVDIDVCGDGEKARDEVALIDADTIAFNACLNAEVVNEPLPREFYTDEEWTEIEASRTEDGSYVTSDIEEAKGKARAKLFKILELTGCSKYELHFTSGRASFRYELYKDYKANRLGLRYPLHLREVKEWLATTYKGFVHTKVEADDVVAYLKRKYPDRYLLCAVDKDILRAVAGRHFNYYESAAYNIDMKFIDTAEEDARLFPYRQALIGDKSDNIIGLQGIGEKRATALIPNGTTDPMRDLILAYTSKGDSELRARLNFSLCYMGDEDLTLAALKEINYEI